VHFDKKSELLYKAIEDNQNTIRFTDTKAGAVLVLTGVFISVSSPVVKDFFLFLKKLYHSEIVSDNVFFWIYSILFLVSLLLVTGSILLAFKAISPKSNPSESVEYDIASSTPPALYYMSSIDPKINIFNVYRDKNEYFKLTNKATQIKDTVTHLTEESAINILIFELQKVSYIREMKIQRVKRSINMLIIAGLLSLGTGLMFLIQKIIS
jgi:hypothetical protein